MKTSTLAVAAALMLQGTLAMATPAPAPTLPNCTAADLGLAGSALGACKGFFEGNLLNNGQATQAVIQNELNGLGIVDYSHWLDKFAGGSVPDDLMVYGDTVIGVRFDADHFGAARPNGGATAFYRFDAGAAGLDLGRFDDGDDVKSIALYKTGAAPLAPTPAAPLLENGVPEPGSAALLLAGLGLAAVTARRRRG